MVPGRGGRQAERIVSLEPPSGPVMALVYDCWLGGTAGLAADRELAAELAAADPGIPGLATRNREFVREVTRRAAHARIGQFIDAGCGLPSASWPGVHQIAREVTPGARVAYVDTEPVVMSAVRPLYASDTTAAVQRDLRDPDGVLADPCVQEVMKLDEPCCVILGLVLHHMAARQAQQVVAGYARLLTPGSWIAASVVTYTDQTVLARLREINTAWKAWSHTPEEFTGFFAGLDLIPPGVSAARSWLRGVRWLPSGKSGDSAYVLCAAAQVP